jgi:hypothetical protein
VANAERTLRYIGHEHAEPVLRSLAYALLMHEDGNPAERDAPADRSWGDNQELASTIRGDWRTGEVKPEATRDLLAVLRNGNHMDVLADVSQDRTKAARKTLGYLSAGGFVFRAFQIPLSRAAPLVASGSTTTTSPLSTS